MAEVVFVERQPLAARVLRDNLARLNAENARVEMADALAWLRQPGTLFEVVLLDPPFGQGLLEPVCAMLEQNGWLADPAWIYLEAETELERLPLPAHWTIQREKSPARSAIGWRGGEYWLDACGCLADRVSR